MPLCGLSTASLSAVLPSGGPVRVVGRVGRVREATNASNGDQELTQGVTLGLRFVTLGSNPPLPATM